MDLLLKLEELSPFVALRNAYTFFWFHLENKSNVILKLASFTSFIVIFEKNWASKIKNLSNIFLFFKVSFLAFCLFVFSFPVYFNVIQVGMSERTVLYLWCENQFRYTIPRITLPCGLLNSIIACDRYTHGYAYPCSNGGPRDWNRE